MATQLADILFVIIAAAIAVSQAVILRSTARGLRYADERAAEQAGSPGPARPRRSALEWSYAIVPALALVALLVFSWRAMHPDSVHVEGTTPPAGFVR